MNPDLTNERLAELERLCEAVEQWDAGEWQAGVTYADGADFPYVHMKGEPQQVVCSGISRATSPFIAAFSPGTAKALLMDLRAHKRALEMALNEWRAFCGICQNSQEPHRWIEAAYKEEQ